MTSSKFDALLKKAELFEKLALYGGRRAFLESLALGPGMVPVEEQNVPGHAPQGYPGEESHEMHSTKNYKPLEHGAYINPEVQKALMKLYPDTMSGSKVDSVFGPRTQGAMNRWRSEHHDNRAHADPTLQRDIIASGGLHSPPAPPKGIPHLGASSKKKV